MFPSHLLQGADLPFPFLSLIQYHRVLLLCLPSWGIFYPDHHLHYMLKVSFASLSISRGPKNIHSGVWAWRGPRGRCDQVTPLWIFKTRSKNMSLEWVDPRLLFSIFWLTNNGCKENLLTRWTFGETDLQRQEKLWAGHSLINQF